jgi:hypothetical protein
MLLLILVGVVNNIVYAVAQQTDGKTILAGSFTV